MKQAKVVYSFTARSENEISFETGDVIYVLEEDHTTGWGKGRTKQYKEGYFPLNYVAVEEVPDSDDEGMITLINTKI
jgi:SH3 domain